MSKEEQEALQAVVETAEQYRKRFQEYMMLVEMNLTEITALWKECPTPVDVRLRLEELCTSR